MRLVSLHFHSARAVGHAGMANSHAGDADLGKLSHARGGCIAALPVAEPHADTRHRDGWRVVLLGGIVVAAMSLGSCASVGVTTSRSGADAWAGCEGERAALEQLEEALSPFPLAASPRLRPFSLISPCSAVRHRLRKASSRLEQQIRSAPDPEDTQLYEVLLDEGKDVG